MTTLSPEGAIVRVQEVVKAFGRNQVLKSVSFSVRAGEKVGIIGASGSGKSTLLKCINFIVKYDEGAIYIDGELVGYEEDKKGKERRLASERKLARLRQKVGMVFQSYNLFPHLTVLDNLTLAPILTRKMKKQDAVIKARDLLKGIGLLEKEKEYPVNLSGGQQQRVAIIRALMMEPKVLLLDEITSALDPSLVGEVLNLLENLARKGLTMLIVSHELGFLERVADRLLFLEGGKILEEGDPKQLLYNPRTPELQRFLRGFYK